MNIKKEFNIEGSTEAIFISKIADALSHPLRVSLINYVLKKNKVRNDICNKDLVDHFPYSQSSLSQHIKKLKEANLFTVEYIDKYSYYTVNKKVLDQFISTIVQL